MKKFKPIAATHTASEQMRHIARRPGRRVACANDEGSDTNRALQVALASIDEVLRRLDGALAQPAPWGVGANVPKSVPRLGANAMRKADGSSRPPLTNVFSF